jgi:hypothetical protein
MIILLHGLSANHIRSLIGMLKLHAGLDQKLVSVYISGQILIFFFYYLYSYYAIDNSDYYLCKPQSPCLQNKLTKKR